MALRETLNANFKQLSEENKVNNAYLTGGLSTEKKMFNQIKEMKRSTFDRSKFEIVGSPSITDDGIANRYNSNNYLYIPFDVNKPFEIKFRARNNSSSTQGTSTFMSLTEWQNSIVSSTPTTFNCWMTTTNPDFSHSDAEKNLSVTVKPGEWYDFYFKWDGAKYTFGAQGATSRSYDSTYPLKSNAAKRLYLGVFRTLTNGEIDLKHFSITVDGVEVFNGNKTGVDQIKKDDYTEVKPETGATLTISDDGIASGFSNSNYLIANGIQDTSKSFKILSPLFKREVLDFNQHYILQSWADSGSGSLRLSVTNKKINLQYRLGDTTTYTTISSQDVVELNNTYQVMIEYTGSKYFIKYQNITLNSGWLDLGTGIIDSNLPLQGNNSQLRIGYHNSNPYGFENGSIDLNAFKIYVDGNLVYQPTLRIPYTQSKTGSKIVDAVYRDRVQSMYAQFGYADYYTLSDTDFTIPMGEIYGMKADKSEIDGVWTYSFLTIAEKVEWQTNTPEATYSLNDYLPKDNNVYEVLIRGLAIPETTVKKYVTVGLKSDIIPSSLITICEGRCQTAGNSGESQGCCVIPVGKERYIKQYTTTSTNAGGTYTLYALAYRKVR